MSTQRFTPIFKEEAVRQVVDRAHTAAEVAAHLGVSAHDCVNGRQCAWRAAPWSGGGLHTISNLEGIRMISDLLSRLV